MFQPQVLYIMGDMKPPGQGSNLSQDSSLNKWPRENCYISGYEDPNEISQDFPERERNLIYVVKISDTEGEIVTRGIPYKLAMLSSHEISHLGKTRISPNWWNHLCFNIWCWKYDKWGYLSEELEKQRISTFIDTVETILGILEEEIE